MAERLMLKTGASHSLRLLSYTDPHSKCFAFLMREVNEASPLALPR